MRVGESFSDFVVARWSMLYRLAVLLVGADRAQGLTEQALVRAYPDWREIAESASAEDRVKALLTRIAVSHEDGAVERATGLEALPARRRVVVVLRCFELMSEAEIAATLRCRTDEVATEERLALAELRASLEAVSADLTRRSEEVVVPEPPVDAIVERGRAARRRRVRRTASWSLVAVLVLAAGLGVGALVQGSPSGSEHPPPTVTIPDRLADLPAGRESRVPYVDGGTFYLAGGRRYTVVERPAALVQAGRHLFVGYRSGEIDRVDVDEGGAETVAWISTGEVVADGSGRYVAWVARSGRAPMVVVQSVDASGELTERRTRRFPSGARCCGDPFVLDGIDASGRLIASRPSYNLAWVWDTVRDPGPEGSVVAIEGLGNGGIEQVTGEKVVVHFPPSHFAVGEVHDGSFLVEQELNALQADFSDPLAKRVVYVDGSQTHVRLLRPSGRSHSERDVRLAVPPLPGGYASLRWEDGGHVLLDVADASVPKGALVRCDVQTGACEIAARFDGRHLLAR